MARLVYFAVQMRFDDDPERVHSHEIDARGEDPKALIEDYSFSSEHEIAESPFSTFEEPNRKEHTGKHSVTFRVHWLDVERVRAFWSYKRKKQ